MLDLFTERDVLCEMQRQISMEEGVSRVVTGGAAEGLALLGAPSCFLFS